MTAGTKRSLLLGAIVAAGGLLFISLQTAQERRSQEARLRADGERVNKIGAYVASLLRTNPTGEKGPFLDLKPSAGEIQAAIGPPDFTGEASDFEGHRTTLAYFAFDYSAPGKFQTIADSWVATEMGRRFGETERREVRHEMSRGVPHARIVYTFIFLKGIYDSGPNLEKVWIGVGPDKDCFVSSGYRNCMYSLE